MKDSSFYLRETDDASRQLNAVKVERYSLLLQHLSVIDYSLRVVFVTGDPLWKKSPKFELNKPSNFMLFR
jgi:hypothetical protein